MTNDKILSLFMIKSFLLEIQFCCCCSIDVCWVFLPNKLTCTREIFFFFFCQIYFLPFKSFVINLLLVKSHLLIYNFSCLSS